MKAFVDRHANLFADDPEIDEENDAGTTEEQQEAFARNILLWVKPLLVNQPWRTDASHGVHGDDSTLQAAYINLRRALANLGHFGLPFAQLYFGLERSTEAWTTSIHRSHTFQATKFIGLQSIRHCPQRTATNLNGAPPFWRTYQSIHQVEEEKGNCLRNADGLCVCVSTPGQRVFHHHLSQAGGSGTFGLA